MSMMADAPALDELRDLGYEFVMSRSHASHVTIWTADRILDDGALTDFEQRLLHDTELDRAISLVAPTLMWDAYRDRVASQFEHIKSLAREEASGPRFALIHAITPHPPFTFEADGSPAPPLECFPLECEAGWIPRGELDEAEFIARYLAQLAHVNRLTLDALDALLEDPDSIVVVMSDHGARYDYDDRSEWYRTLFAARTPGHEGAFDEAPHPTALIATIARAYFGADVELPSTTRYAMIDDNRLRLRPLP
jgi:arylsulfatase A-like enzyme